MQMGMKGRFKWMEMGLSWGLIIYNLDYKIDLGFIELRKLISRLEYSPKLHSFWNKLFIRVTTSVTI